MDSTDVAAHHRAHQSDHYYASLKHIPNEAGIELGVERVEPLNGPCTPQRGVGPSSTSSTVPAAITSASAQDESILLSHLSLGPPIPPTSTTTTNTNLNTNTFLPNGSSSAPFQSPSDVKISQGPKPGVEEDGIREKSDPRVTKPFEQGMKKVHPSVRIEMSPYLQMMCGPLLVYRTVIDNVWYGAALIVTLDGGSQYDQPPTLSLSSIPSKFAFSASAQPTPDQSQQQPWKVTAERIHLYTGPLGSSSFWRFNLSIPLFPHEQSISYSLNDGTPMSFLVPGNQMNMRWMAHSCNGFSDGIDQKVYMEEGKGFETAYDPLWEDVLKVHEERGLHCMAGGGDQIYCDSISHEPELQDWLSKTSPKDKIAYQLTDAIQIGVDRYYFSHYCRLWREGAFGRANCSIPMLNCLDDHDLIDGFGSYDEETMEGPVFKYIGSRGYFWYCLFQLCVVDKVDGLNPTPGSHPAKNMVLTGTGTYIPSPGHTQPAAYLGPKVYMCLLDCRAERSLDRVCSEKTYDLVFDILSGLPAGVEQLVMLLGIPILYPRMSFIENVLDSKFNPLNIIQSIKPTHMGGFMNKFNGRDAELLDDLNDHWCNKHHKHERNELLLRCQQLALQRKIRITFLSGDVHCAAVGQLFTLYHKASHRVEPAEDHRWMVNIVTSAIVNAPPPPPAQLMSNEFASHKHRTLHHHYTDETMQPLFAIDTDETKRASKYIMGRRNYALVERGENGDLNFDIMVEKSPGSGTTKPYRVEVPAPRW